MFSGRRFGYVTLGHRKRGLWGSPGTNYRPQGSTKQLPRLNKHPPRSPQKDPRATQGAPKCPEAIPQVTPKVRQELNVAQETHQIPEATQPPVNWPTHHSTNQIPCSSATKILPNHMAAGPPDDHVHPPNSPASRSTSNTRNSTTPPCRHQSHRRVGGTAKRKQFRYMF